MDSRSLIVPLVAQAGHLAHDSPAFSLTAQSIAIPNQIMGGEHDRLTAAEAASVIGWWIEAGVDVAIQEEPRAWLGEAAAHVPVAVPLASVAPAPEQEIPTSLEAFRGWLGKSPSPPPTPPTS